MTLTFGYWNIRGYGSAIRLLLRYVGAKYQDTIYQYDPLPNYKDPWFKVRQTFGLDFPNLPYLIDGDLKLTQSHAILRYLGRKFGLEATQDPGKALEDMVYFQLNDLSMRLIQTAYWKPYNSDADLQAEIQLLKQDLANHLQLLEQFLAESDFFTGNSLSYVDFWAYEIIDRFRQVVDGECLKNFPKLAGFMARVEGLEQLKEILSSDEYKNSAIFGPAAKLGGVKRS